MPSFQKQFEASRGQPIEYEGKLLTMMDRVAVGRATAIRVTFEHCAGDWRQGVRLKCDGEFLVNEQKIPGKGGFVLWQDTAPRISDVAFQGKVNEIRIYNVWDIGNGVIESWHNGAAMIIEEIPNGKRYRCNDGRADDDFDDLVFSIELIQ